MTRTLLLCFIHGFKGDDNTFQSFPEDLQREVRAKLPDHVVESVVYPKYETKGELAQAAERLLAWLKERVMEVRKARLETPWPANDRQVGVVLVAHSMGGFVATDTLFLALNERKATGLETTFPPIHGILAFDTPYNGLARSMFVYGAFSNYQRVSSVFNVMTALTAAPAVLGKTALKRSTAALPAVKTSSPLWKGWQLVAVRTGTVGAIAAGGVAAYVHRKQIMDGVRNVRSLNKDSVKDGYQQGVDAIGQGLAYINRGNVGRSFEYLSDHFTFVASLLKTHQLSRRLERMGALRGIGIHDYYTSLGENGLWSGGYFVPERTFCAVPDKEHPAYALFSRQLISEVDDEVQAHMSIFKPDKNTNYGQMTVEASDLVVAWFGDETSIFDDPSLSEPAAPEPAEEVEVVVVSTEDGKEVPKTDQLPDATDTTDTMAPAAALPDESPLDIAAAASVLPLPADDAVAAQGLQVGDASEQTYMRHLLRVAQQAGTGLRSYVPQQMPDMPQMPRIPAGPSLRSFVPGMPSLPSVNLFSKKQKRSVSASASDSDLPERGQLSGGSKL